MMTPETFFEAGIKWVVVLTALGIVIRAGLQAVFGTALFGPRPTEDEDEDTE